MERKLIRQFRLVAFVGLLGLAVKLLPDDAEATMMWLANMPFEE